MRYLKLFESFNKNKIDSICNKYGITNYTINDDGSIDVDKVLVDLKEYKLNRLPLKFNNTNMPLDGWISFNCSENQLISLEGSPINIKGSFNCSENNLTSLEGGPKYVSGSYNCEYNNIRTFEGFPNHIGTTFYCRFNPVYRLWILFQDKDKVELFNDFGITDGEVIILQRLNEFLEMIGYPTVTDVSKLEKEGYKII